MKTESYFQTYNEPVQNMFRQTTQTFNTQVESDEDTMFIDEAAPPVRENPLNQNQQDNQEEDAASRYFNSEPMKPLKERMKAHEEQVSGGGFPHNSHDTFGGNSHVGHGSGGY